MNRPDKIWNKLSEKKTSDELIRRRRKKRDGSHAFARAGLEHRDTLASAVPSSSSSSHRTGCGSPLTSFSSEAMLSSATTIEL